MSKISLLMAIHCHQPVGNFDGVFAHAYEKSYLPFIEVMERFPQIRISLHYTGPLLNWLMNNRPDFIARLKALADSGRVEILSGGYYEPILTLLPESDAIGQITMMNDFIKCNFSQDPSGMWLAERVWEPKLPDILAKSGMRYTIVDDSHFASVGWDVESLSGYYACEDNGNMAFVFPTSEKLRYFMPFKLPHETIDYMRQKYESGFKALTFGDDGEKFGLWPGTYQWVYNEKWLERFFSLLVENSSWLRTQTFSDFISQNPPSGHIYLPCVSYREMLQWSGGYYRNFLVKYPESNKMHKRMLWASKKMEQLSISHPAKKHIYMSQCNCGYWHGVFGGLYLNHLRSAIYKNIILAERQANTLPKGLIKQDIDLNGVDEVVLASESMALFVGKDGQVFEWDLYEKAVNISNVLSRRYEKYHDKVIKGCQVKPDRQDEGVVSIHDINSSNVKDPKILKYDAYLRDTFRVVLIRSEKASDLYAHSHVAAWPVEVKLDTRENAVFVEERYSFEAVGNLFVKKLLYFTGKNEIRCSIDVDHKLPDNIGLGLEMNYSLYSNDFSKSKKFHGPETEYWFKDEWYGINIIHRFNQPVRLYAYPVETVSDSEQGIESTFQGSCLFFVLKKQKGDALHFDVNVRVE